MIEQLGQQKFEYNELRKTFDNEITLLNYKCIQLQALLEIQKPKFNKCLMDEKMVMAMPEFKIEAFRAWKGKFLIFCKSSRRPMYKELMELEKDIEKHGKGVMQS